MAEDQPVEGLDEAQAQMTVLQAIAEAGMGISYYFPGGRNDGVSNEDILKWQAEGNSRSADPKKRDIRPNAEDSEKMGELFVESVDKQLARVGKATKSGKTVSQEDAARAGGAGGLRAAAKYQANTMVDRLDAQVDNNGEGLEKVSPEYAAQRARDEGVGEDVVFYNTGQFMNAMVSGQYKLFFDTSKVQKMLSLIDR